MSLFTSRGKQKRAKQDQVCRFIQRIVNLSTPSVAPLEGDAREVPRYNRSLPVVLAPVEGKHAVVEQATYALTKDLTDFGLALVLRQPFRVENVVVGFWRDGDPGFLKGKVRFNAALGGGFWQLGVELHEVLPIDWPGISQLIELATPLDVTER